VMPVDYKRVLALRRLEVREEERVGVDYG